MADPVYVRLEGILSTSVSNPSNPALPGVGIPAGGTTGQVLAKVDGTDYNVTWANDATGGGGGGGVTDHGGLTGLGDDDHPQYAKVASNLADLTSPAIARASLGLGGAATLSVGTTAGTVAAGDDSRLSDARTPTTHTHVVGNVTGLDEQIRDVMGTAIVAGSGITVTVNDGADTITVAATGGGGGGSVNLGTDGTLTFDKHSSAPASPSAGNVVVYVKSDGLLYTKTEAGVETVVGQLAPKISSSSVDGSGNAVVTVVDPYADRWQFYVAGVVDGNVLTSVPTAYVVKALSPGVATEIMVRGWRNASPTDTRDSNVVTLTRAAGPPVSSLRHNFFDGDSVPETGQTFTFTCNQRAIFSESAGAWREIGANQITWAGVDKQYKNVYPSSGTPATQTFTLAAGVYSIQVVGTGSLAFDSTGDLAPVTATAAGGPVQYDLRPLNADTVSVTATLTGSLTSVMMYRLENVATWPTEVETYIADSVATQVVAAGGRQRMIITGPEYCKQTSFGMKPATTGFVGIFGSSFNRGASEQFSPAGDAEYFLKEDSGNTQHAVNSGTLNALNGVQWIDFFVSKIASATPRGIAMAVAGATGGKFWVFVNPVTAVINGTYTEGTPVLTGYSAEVVRVVGDNVHVRVKFTVPSTQNVVAGYYLTSSLTSTTTGDTTYTGNNTSGVYVWGGYATGVGEISGPILLGDTNPRPKRTAAYTMSDWSSTNMTLKVRGRLRPNCTGYGQRYLIGWTNGGLRVTSANLLELVVNNTTVITGPTLREDTDVSIAFRLKSGDFEMAVDRLPTYTSATVAALGTTTTLYLGADGAGNTSGWCEIDTFESDPSAQTFGDLSYWTSGQGTSGTTVTNPPDPGTVTKKWTNAYNGMWIRIAEWLGNPDSGASLAKVNVINGWNSGNGFARIKGVHLFWSLKNVCPTTPGVYNWTELDAITARLDTLGVGYIIVMIENSFGHQPVNATSKRCEHLFPPDTVNWNKYSHSYIAGLTGLYLERDEPKMEEWDGATKYFAAAQKAIVARYKDNVRFLGVSGTESAKLGLRSTNIPPAPAGTDGSETRKVRAGVNVQRMRKEISQANPKTLSGAYQSFSWGSSASTSTATQVADMATWGNAMQSWPDTDIPNLQGTAFYWFDVGRANSDKVVIMPGVQAGIVTGTLTEAQTIWNLAKTRITPHAMVWEPKSQTYFESVVHVVAATVNSEVRSTVP
jgi:hypothetical protein